MNYTKALMMCAAVGVAAAGVFAIAPPAFGQTRPVYVVGREDVISRHVSYADLNLASASGEITLNRRVGAAVNDLCLDATGGNDGSTNFKYSMIHCSSHAWDGARPQIEQAVERARQIAATGSSSIVAAAITISLPPQ